MATLGTQFPKAHLRGREPDKCTLQGPIVTGAGGGGDRPTSYRSKFGATYSQSSHQVIATLNRLRDRIRSVNHSRHVRNRSKAGRGVESARTTTRGVTGTACRTMCGTTSTEALPSCQNSERVSRDSNPQTRVTLKGAETSFGHAAASYSWISPPQHVRRRTPIGPPLTRSGGSPGSGVPRSSDGDLQSSQTVLRRQKPHVPGQGASSLRSPSTSDWPTTMLLTATTTRPIAAREKLP
jgi:hypothetical protein